MNSPACESSDPDLQERDVHAQEFEKALYHITHDFRATLRAMRTLPEWIRADLAADHVIVSDSVLESLKMLEKQALRADNMLLDLRTYSRIGRIQDKVSLVPLKPAIENAVADLKPPPGFIVNTDLQLHAIKAPFNECQLLFEVLISNAIKHHDGSVGTVQITTSNDNQDILIAVEDDGPGIPREYRDRVFEMMAMLQSRDDCEGSGLGLSIARKIVGHQGGEISIADPKYMKGTRIEVRLPAQSAALTTIV